MTWPKIINNGVPLDVVALQDEVGSRVHVDAVPDELPHQLDVRLVHALRVRQDLSHMNWHRHLQRKPHKSTFNLVHVLGNYDKYYHKNTWENEKLFIQGNINVLGQCEDWDLERWRYVRRNLHAFLTDCLEIDPAFPWDADKSHA